MDCLVLQCSAVPAASSCMFCKTKDQIPRDREQLFFTRSSQLHNGQLRWCNCQGPETMREPVRERAVFVAADF
jgi:hypothetical protein